MRDFDKKSGFEMWVSEVETPGYGFEWNVVKFEPSGRAEFHFGGHGDTFEEACGCALAEFNDQKERVR